MHTDDDVMAINTEEWDLVARLLAAMSPREDGPYPGAQLSQFRAGRIWTLTDGTMTVDVRCGGSIPGLGEPVWMTAQSGVVRGGDRRGGRAVLQGHHRRSSRGERHGRRGGRRGWLRRSVRPAVPGPDPHPVSAGARCGARHRHHRHGGAAARREGGVAHPGRRAGERPTLSETFGIDNEALVLVGTDRRGVDRPAEFRLRGEVQCELTPAIDVQFHVGLAPLLAIVDQLPLGEVIVVLTSVGELWLIAGPCRVVLRGDLRQSDPYDTDGVIYLVGRVEGTDEAVLSLDGGCPADDTIVWLESEPEDCGQLDRIERLHHIVWYAEPEPYGVGAVDD